MMIIQQNGANGFNELIIRRVLFYAIIQLIV